MKNVILLTIDALRADHTQPYGYRRETTPFLNSIAKKSIVFKHTFSTGPYTQSSFPGLLTSTHYLDVDDKKKLSKQRTLISEILKKNGITTAAFHSNPYLSGFFGYNRGWDHFYDSMDTDLPADCPYETATGINARSENWLTEWREENADRSEPQPFFLWMHYMDVHEPYVPTQESLSTINPDLQITRDEMTALFKHTLLPRNVDNPEDVKKLHELYDAQILDTDHALRNFFTYLENNNLLENTTIIITADHGDEFNEHGGLSHDAKMYNELIRVPLLIYNSGEEPRVFDGLTSTMDVSPTILKLFGLSNPPNYRGTSMLPTASYQRNTCLSEAIDKTTHERVHSLQTTDKKIIRRSDKLTYFDSDLKETTSTPLTEAPSDMVSTLNTFATRDVKPHESAIQQTTQTPKDDLLDAAEDLHL